MTRTSFVLGGLLALCLPGGDPLAAQGLGSAAVFGTVRTEDGLPAPLARVELRYVPTGTVVRTLTNEDGRYQLFNVRPGGPYTLTVGSLGFANLERSDIQLRAEQRLELNLTLTERPIALAVIDVAADRRFDVSRAGPATTMTRDAIASHPTIERSFLEMATRSPVVIQTTEGGGLSISGQNERQNAVLVDGALNQDVFGASSSGLPGAAARAKPIPLEAIHEFRVEVAPFDARSSGFTGGVLNAITRSGTNVWEGSVLSQIRDERLFGSLMLDGVDIAPTDYRKQVYGVSLGGPLRHDRAHVFFAAEFESRREPAPGYSLGVHDPITTHVSADSMARLVRIFESGYGVDPGTPQQVSLENPLANVFTRLDWRLTDRHVLTLRHNYAGAARDSTPNRAPFGAYELSSAGYRISSRNHAISALLASRFGAGHSNELSLNVQHSRERSTPNANFPQVDVRVSSSFDDVGLVRHVRAGARYFSQHNELDQTVVEVMNALTLARDRIVTTVGVDADIFHFRHDYRPGSLGYYRFDRLVDLEANLPSYYEVNVLDGSADDHVVRFTVAQPALFVQNEHRFPPELVLRYGIRLDVPLFPSQPDYNAAVDSAFGIRTDRLPGGKLLFSPRLGFNWQSQADRWRTQLRGGFGLFTGRIPFIWMADAYRNNGLRGAVLACRGEDAPAFDPTAPAPLACAAGGTASTAGQSTVVGFSRDFRYPRELKVTTAIDQQLPLGFLASVEGLFVQTHGRTIVSDVNVGAPGTPGDQGYARAFGFRAHYGRAAGIGYVPERRVPGFAQVLLLDNDERSATAWSVTAQLEKRFGAWLDLSGSVTFARSTDRQSLVFTDMLTNHGAAPVGQLISDLNIRPANFDRPRKYLGSLRTRLPGRWGGTELSVVYTGQSGQPYSYVYGSDINGDGYSGPGIPLDAGNDLIFVPENPASIPGTLTAKALFAQLARTDPCLADVRAAIVERNSCRAPATHHIDMRLAQPVTWRGVRLELSADLLNALNLLRSDWGRVWEVDPLVPVLDIVDRSERSMSGAVIPTSQALLGYTGSVRRDAEGALRPGQPFNLILPASQWQAQLGLKISF